jgi:hypothetical protein
LIFWLAFSEPEMRLFNSSSEILQQFYLTESQVRAELLADSYVINPVLNRFFWYVSKVITGETGLVTWGGAEAKSTMVIRKFNLRS